MRGLLNQKGDRPAPREGESLRLLTENRTSKGGKPWIKFKRDRDGDGYTVLAVEPSDRGPDDYGNLGYWIEVEETTDLLPPHTPMGNPPKQLDFKKAAGGPLRDARGEPTPEYWDSKDRRIQRQHSQEMAVRYVGLRAEHFPMSNIKDLIPVIDWFDKDATKAGIPTVPGRENTGSPMAGANSGGGNPGKGVEPDGESSHAPSASSSTGTAGTIPVERVSDLLSRIETLGIRDDDVRMRMVRVGVTDIGSVDVALASLTTPQADELEAWLQSIAKLELAS